jgi:hypothetical protein
MPDLFSHCLSPDASIARVLGQGLDLALAPRLSTTAARQLGELRAMVEGIQLSPSSDRRTLSRCAAHDGGLHFSALYKLCMHGGVAAPFADFVWESYTSSRVKFLAWLCMLERIQVRANLLKKKILAPAECLCPLCRCPLETVSHLLFGCRFACSLWSSHGVPPAPALPLGDACRCPLPSSVPPCSASTLR